MSVCQEDFQYNFVCITITFIYFLLFYFAFCFVFFFSPLLHVAEDCTADQNFTVPIVVGAALGALVILVMVAYFIGRRNRRSAGYEHF